MKYLFIFCKNGYFLHFYPPDPDPNGEWSLMRNWIRILIIMVADPKHCLKCRVAAPNPEIFDCIHILPRDGRAFLWVFAFRMPTFLDLFFAFRISVLHFFLVPQSPPP